MVCTAMCDNENGNIRDKADDSVNEEQLETEQLICKDLSFDQDELGEDMSEQETYQMMHNQVPLILVLFTVQVLVIKYWNQTSLQFKREVVQQMLTVQLSIYKQHLLSLFLKY